MIDWLGRLHKSYRSIYSKFFSLFTSLSIPLSIFLTMILKSLESNVVVEVVRFGEKKVRSRGLIIACG